MYSFLGNVNLFKARIKEGVLVAESGEHESIFAPFLHDIEISFSKKYGSHEGKILHYRILGDRITLEVQIGVGADAQVIEAQIDKGTLNEIRDKNIETIYVNFLNLKAHRFDKPLNLRNSHRLSQCFCRESHLASPCRFALLSPARPHLRRFALLR